MIRGIQVLLLGLVVLMQLPLAAQAQKNMKWTKSGLGYQQLEKGAGLNPEPFDLVELEMLGHIKDGREIVDTKKQGNPLRVMIGRKAIPEGLEQGILMMGVGGRYRFEVPAELAYGVEGTDVIPSNATLVYEVKLLDIRSVFQPLTNLGMDTVVRASGLKYLVSKPGDGPPVLPNERVSLHYYMMLPDGTIIDSSWDTGLPLSFVIGNRAVIDGLEEGVSLMREGSEYRFFIPPSLAYGQDGYKDRVGPNQHLICDVQVVRFGR